LARYPDPEATRFRERAAAMANLPVDHVLAGNGSDELLALVLRATIDPGDRVAFPSPTYSLYETLVAVQGAETVRVPFSADWALPEAGLLAAGARVTFLCNPNSPSGTFTPVDVVRRLASRIEGLVVVDEAYVDFADDTALRLVRELPNVLVLRTLSKSHGLAGLRAGLLFGSPELLAGVRAVKDSYNLNTLTQVAAAVALEDEAYMRGNVARIRATRERLSTALAGLGFTVQPSQANFVLARRAGVDMGPLAGQLEAGGVIVRHFPTPELADALRISVGTDEEIDVLLARLRELSR